MIQDEQLQRIHLRLTVQMDVENAESACKKMQQLIEARQEEHNRRQSEVAELRQNVNRLTTTKLKLGHNLQQRQSLVERQRVLEQAVEQSRKDLESWKCQLQPLVAKQSAAQSAHLDAQKRRNVVLEQARNKVTLFCLFKISNCNCNADNTNFFSIFYKRFCIIVRLIIEIFYVKDNIVLNLF